MEVAFHMDVGQQELVGIAAHGRFRFGKRQTFKFERSYVDGKGGAVHNLHAFPYDRYAVVHREIQFHHHIAHCLAATEREDQLASRSRLLVQRPTAACPFDFLLYGNHLEVLHQERLRNGG